jgi:hypothetical protein
LLLGACKIIYISNLEVKRVWNDYDKNIRGKLKKKEMVAQVTRGVGFVLPCF